MSLLFLSNRIAFFHAFYMAFNFFKVTFDFTPFQKQDFARVKRIGVPPKEEKCRLCFSLIEWLFFMHFYVPFHFFKVPFELPPFQNQHFARLKSIGVPPKEEICHFFFSLLEQHFFVHIYLPFHFTKVSFAFPSLPKAPFCRAKMHWGTPKEEKCHFSFSVIERHF